MPTYPYACADLECKHTFDVIKSVTRIDDPETCEKCGGPANRYISTTHFYGASDWDRAEWNPGLGCVTKNARHRKEMARRKGCEEIGNEKADVIIDAADRDRERKLSQVWDKV